MCVCTAIQIASVFPFWSPDCCYFSYVWLVVTQALKSHTTLKRPMTNDDVEFNN